MSSFLDVLNELKTVLESNKELQFLAKTCWKKNMSAYLLFRRRIEIPLADLPIILITRPEVKDRNKPRVNIEEARHIVRLYIGFVQNDYARALAEQVVLEEAIDDAITRDNPFRDLALETAVTNSVNDEGMFHPTYFTVMDIEFLHERKQS